jgi:hypothetical protein
MSQHDIPHRSPAEHATVMANSRGCLASQLEFGFGSLELNKMAVRNQDLGLPVSLSNDALPGRIGSPSKEHT